MRIRHFGFLANRCRAQRIEEIRAATDAAQQPETTPRPRRLPLSTAIRVLCADRVGYGSPLT